MAGHHPTQAPGAAGSRDHHPDERVGARLATVTSNSS